MLAAFSGRISAQTLQPSKMHIYHAVECILMCKCSLFSVFDSLNVTLANVNMWSCKSNLSLLAAILSRKPDSYHKI